MKRSFQYGDETLSLEVIAHEKGFRVRLPDGTEHTIQARRLTDDRIEVTVPLFSASGEGAGDRIYRIPRSQHSRDAISLSWEGETYSFTPISNGGQGHIAGKRPRSGVLTAPMVGVVVAVNISPGDLVTAYQPLVVIEAMKVLATLEAPFAGVVNTVSVRKGDRVEHGAVLVEITPQPESEPEESS